MVILKHLIITALLYHQFIFSYIFERYRLPTQPNVSKINIPIQFSNWGLLKLVCPTNFQKYKPMLLESMRKPTVTDNIPKELQCKIDKNSGFGVDVYVLDTGINYNHVELGGRVRMGKNFVPGEPNLDIHGHGSHVAGIIGSISYGLAKESRLISTKVLDKDLSGYSQAVIQAIKHIQTQIKFTNRPSIIHMSATVEFNKELNDLVKQTVLEYNTAIIIAAGNGGEDACKFSPASSKYALTVSAIDINFQDGNPIPAFTNFGSCVDLLAPGKDILSLTNRDNSTARFRTGSSMAAPYVTGLAATLLAKGYTNGLELYKTLKDTAYLDKKNGLKIAQLPPNI